VKAVLLYESADDVRAKARFTSLWCQPLLAAANRPAATVPATSMTTP
jgi:hypothetical protein